MTFASSSSPRRPDIHIHADLGRRPVGRVIALGKLPFLDDLEASARGDRRAHARDRLDTPLWIDGGIDNAPSQWGVQVLGILLTSLAPIMRAPRERG